MLEPDTEILVEIAGEEVPAMVVEEGDVEAAYGAGPERVYPVSVPGAGTYRVPESDITAPV